MNEMDFLGTCGVAQGFTKEDWQLKAPPGPAPTPKKPFGAPRQH